MQTLEISKWGNSSAVRLPAPLLKQIKAGPGDRLEVTTEGDRLVLKRAPGREYSLEELLAGMTQENRHDLVDFGAPVGREEW